MKEHCNRDSITSHVSVPSVGSRELVEKYKVKFLKEASTIAGLDNVHVVRIYDIFEENDTAYYVMEYLGNESLMSRIPAGGFPCDQAIGYVRQIADALKYIHSKNILHLDIKPSNVLFRHDTEAVLIDFGISKHYDGTDGGQTSTSSGCVSEGYSPMEQYEVDGISSFTAATDVYSLGATFYHLVCGRVPAKASVILNEGLSDFPDSVPFSCRQLIEKCMQPRRRERPQNMYEFMDFLTAVQSRADSSTVVISPAARTTSQEADVSTQVVSAPPKAEKKKKKRSCRWIWWLLVVILLLAGGAYMWYSNNRRNEAKNVEKVSEMTLEERAEHYANGYYDALYEDDLEQMESIENEYQSWYASLPEDDQIIVDKIVERVNSERAPTVEDIVYDYYDALTELDDEESVQDLLYDYGEWYDSLSDDEQEIADELFNYLVSY